MVTLTGFTDEALTSFTGQVRLARSLGLGHVELRRIGAVGVLSASPGRLADAETCLDDHGVRVSCLASRIGKASVDDPLGPQLDTLRRAAALAHRFRTPYVRVFSWFTPQPDADRGHVLCRARRLAEVAEDEDVVLLHENEKGTFGSTPDRCLDLAEAAGPRLRLIFDPANYVQCGVRPIDDAWPLVADHVAYVHVKDAVADTRRVVRLGHGDAEVRRLARTLRDAGWSGFTSVEPHLGLGGRGAPVRPARWADAVRDWQRILAQEGITAS